MNSFFLKSHICCPIQCVGTLTLNILFIVCCKFKFSWKSWIYFVVVTSFHLTYRPGCMSPFSTLPWSLLYSSTGEKVSASILPHRNMRTYGSTLTFSHVVWIMFKWNLFAYLLFMYLFKKQIWEYLCINLEK